MSRKDKSTGQQPQQPRSSRITPVEIQQKEFRLAMRGYNERDVDQFLDELTEEVARLHAENKRLREQADVKRTAPITTGDAVEADRTLRDARDEAERILAEARSRATSLAASAASAGAGPAAPSPAEPASAPLVTRFLSREREFLQSLAGLIQQHAESVKGDVRLVRASPPEAPAAEASTDPQPESATASDGSKEPATSAGAPEAEAPPEPAPPSAGEWSNAAHAQASEGTAPQDRWTSDQGMYGQGQPAEEAWATGTAEAAGQATPELTEPDVEFQQPERSTWMDPAGSEPDLPAGGDQAAAAERPLPWDAPEETFDAQASPEATPAGGVEAPEMAEAAPIASTVTEAGDDDGPSAGPDPWEPAAEEASSSEEVGPADDSPDPDHGRASNGPDSNGTSSEDVLPPTQQMDVITLDDPDPPGDEERADVSEPAPIFSSATAGTGATFGGSSGGRGLAGDVRPEAAFDDQDDGEERSLRELFWGED